MIKYFVFLFLAMFVIGLIIGKVGGAIIALCCAGFMCWAGKEMAKQDARRRSDRQVSEQPKDKV